MKVGDILRVKGNTLYALGPDQTLWQAVQTRCNAEGLHPRLAGAGER